MCHAGCINFITGNITSEEVFGRKVLDVGSLDVNGSPRTIILQFQPSMYLGVDIINGRGVDEICDAENLVDKYGVESFDVVISTEMLEHVANWRKVISNMKQVCKKEGLILLTTRSKGFGQHNYPHDYWRYEVEDMQRIFGDCEILKLEKDPQYPGVFIKARKPADFKEMGLLEMELYKING